MSANETQVGGTHYKSEYQHWDWVTELGMPYILGCATKYLTRWKKKNGIQDLEKAIHYVEKAMELNMVIEGNKLKLRLTGLFIHENMQGATTEITALNQILYGDYPAAVGTIRTLIAAAQADKERLKVERAKPEGKLEVVEDDEAMKARRDNIPHHSKK